MAGEESASVIRELTERYHAHEAALPSEPLTPQAADPVKRVLTTVAGSSATLKSDANIDSSNPWQAG